VIVILREPWRAHPLAWIHRAEARAIAAELRAAGADVRLARIDDAIAQAARTVLVRMSDPVMLPAVERLQSAGIAYCGPDPEVLARCYDKARAYAIARSNGIECPHTVAAVDADPLPRPLVLKPRRGSDSIGLKVLRTGPIPASCRHRDYLAQPLVRGAELTVAILGNEVGVPLRIVLGEDALYTFRRKYLRPPAREPLTDARLAERVRELALRAARAFGIGWAARLDLIHERTSDRLVVLECDAAPLVGARSAFGASLAAAGITRQEQLRRLLGERVPGAGSARAASRR